MNPQYLSFLLTRVEGGKVSESSVVHKLYLAHFRSSVNSSVKTVLNRAKLFPVRPQAELLGRCVRRGGLIVSTVRSPQADSVRETFFVRGPSGDGASK